MLSKRRTGSGETWNLGFETPQACGGVDEVFVLLGEVFVGEVVAAVCGDAELFECDAVVGVDAG
jgi:hypothetical protein